MGTWYVDFDAGIDTDAGTQANPWKTIPGTRKADETGWQTAEWGGGTINSTNKVPKGSIFYLKSGTTHDLSNGGKILINSTFYVTNADATDKISFFRKTDWGTGQITIDGTGAILTGGFGIIHITIAGVLIDGVAANGILIENSSQCGISHYNATTSYIGPWIYRCEFYNNGTAYSATESSSSGNIKVLQSLGGEIAECLINGNNMMLCAICLGEDEKRCVDFIIRDCVVHNLTGIPATNDGGIGYKAFNCQLLLQDSVAYDCLKGADLGQEGDIITWDMSYKVINCEFYENEISGIAFSGHRATYTGTVKWYLINCICRDNSVTGARSYSGPYELYVINCLFDNNAYYNLQPYCDGVTDTFTIRIYYYNNIFYKSLGGHSGSAELTASYWYDSGHDTEYHGDYNSWVKYGASVPPYAIYLGVSGANPHGFEFGANGPGHAPGNWYDFPTAAPWHNDANGKGTGCTDTTLPPFTDVANHDYTLTAGYAGTDISGESWYINEMGTDKAGNARATWDIGPYEYISGPRNIPATIADGIKTSDTRLGQWPGQVGYISKFARLFC